MRIYAHQLRAVLGANGLPTDEASDIAAAFAEAVYWYGVFTLDARSEAWKRTCEAVGVRHDLSALADYFAGGGDES